jgi:hypothetical protein
MILVGSFYDRDDNDYHDGSDDGPPRKTSEDIIRERVENGYMCREILVKETKKLFRSEVPTFQAYILSCSLNFFYFALSYLKFIY